MVRDRFPPRAARSQGPMPHLGLLSPCVPTPFRARGGRAVHCSRRGQLDRRPWPGTAPAAGFRGRESSDTSLPLSDPHFRHLSTGDSAPKLPTCHLLCIRPGMPPTPPPPRHRPISFKTIQKYLGIHDFIERLFEKTHLPLGLPKPRVCSNT